MRCWRVLSGENDLGVQETAKCLSPVGAGGAVGTDGREGLGFTICLLGHRCHLMGSGYKN